MDKDLLRDRFTGQAMGLLMCWPPLYRDSNRYANRYRGWVPDLEDFGYLKYDYDCYNLKWYEVWGKDPGVIDLNELSEWEKLIIKEHKERMEYIQFVIQKHHESKIQVYYPDQVEDKKKIGNKVSVPTH